LRGRIKGPIIGRGAIEAAIRARRRAVRLKTCTLGPILDFTDKKLI